MPAIPESLIGRDREWRALADFVDGGHGVALVYGRRQSGTSFLLDAFAESLGGLVHRSAPGTRHLQLRSMAEFLGGGADPDQRPVSNWAGALDRVRRLDVPVVVLDDIHHVIANAPDLADAVARYADVDRGPALVLAGSSPPRMLGLLGQGSPLFGRVKLALSPSPLPPRDHARLWGVERPTSALWVDAVVGGLPGHRPLIDPPGDKVSSWMRSVVLAPRSPLLDGAESTLADQLIDVEPGLGRAVLDAVAAGSSTPQAVALEIGVDADAAQGVLHVLERSGAVSRIADPIRGRRDIYDIADPYLRFWLAIVAPHRSDLSAGRSAQVWGAVRDSVWRTRVLNRRWESVVRQHVARPGFIPRDRPPVAIVGATPGMEVVAVDTERAPCVLGRVSLDALGLDDLRRLEQRRDELGLGAVTFVLASTVRVDEAARRAGAVAVTPADIYGSLDASDPMADQSGPLWRPVP